MAENTAVNVYIGSVSAPDFYFNKDSLIEISANMGIDAIGNELSIDTLDLTVYYDDAAGALRGLTYATPIWYYQGSALIGKFYFKSIERTAAKRYRISAVSVIGLLEYEKHYGGYFSGKNVKSAVRETFITDGLKVLMGKEYAQWKASSSSIPLKSNYVGDSVDASGTQTAVLVVFSVDEVLSGTSDHLIWLAMNELDIDSDARYYDIGVTVTGGSSTQFTVRVYATLGTNAQANTPVGGFTARYGDYIELLICPYLGNFIYRINSGSVSSQSYTRVTANHLVRMWGSAGCGYFDESLFPAVMVADASYRLYNLMFGSRDGTWNETYLNLIPVENISTGAQMFYDMVSGLTYPMDGSAPISGETIAWHYETGGEDVAVDSPAFLDDADLNGELANIAEAIVWQAGTDTLTFNGWIPQGTKREVLHQILFALNLNMYKSSDGNIVIGTLPGAVEGEISGDEIYDEGSVEAVKKPKRIELTEHFYNIPSEPAETVFDNSAATIDDDAYVAEFSQAPVYGRPTSSTIVILNYNANAALVKGKGVISAQVYHHSKRVITANVDTRPDGETVSVSDATLVTFLNATNVMNKLKAYYANAAYKIKNAIIAGDRKLGRKYGLLTPFQEAENAYLMNVNLNASNVLKFNCEFLAGYTPVNSGNIYSAVELLTGSGSWTVPEGVTQIHVVLIGGGRGGDSGSAGETGQAGSGWTSSSPADGGEHGENGSGGKVFSADISVTPGQSFSFACGSGGEGGAISSAHDTHNPGSDGGDTTFGSYSSANGDSNDYGYTEILSGFIYAAKPAMVLPDGGKGGALTVARFSGDTPAPADISKIDAENVYNPITDQNFRGGTSRTWVGINNIVQSIGGCGGGAALNRSGANYSGLNGGNGADATFIPPKADVYNENHYGYGGYGGAGGGAGGAAGYNPDFSSAPGSGGYGGQGGAGGDGCIFVYS